MEYDNGSIGDSREELIENDEMEEKIISPSYRHERDIDEKDEKD